MNLNCERHQRIFTAKKIILEFCFGCFKVQVEVDSVLSLIRLTSLFYEFNFDVSLTSKTMVEMRSDIPGFYKGLIYCRGLEQANEVKDCLDKHLIDLCGKKVTGKIKRGCSEFVLEIPEYGEITNDRIAEMDYPKVWKPD